jgi:peroxin-11B
MSQLVTDSFDIWLPANSLGYSHFNEGVIGFFGAMTSYMALQKQWRKVGSAMAKA